MKGWPSIKELQSSKVAGINPQLFEKVEELPAKRSKYGNSKTVVDGIEFDSAKEAIHYKTLRLLLKSGDIGLLRCQVEYELNPGGRSIKYIADFVYIKTDTGETIVEDVKSKITKKLPVYRMKKKLMEDKHGIVIKEV